LSVGRRIGSRGRDFEAFSFSIFHFPFDVTARRAIPAMSNEELDMESGKRDT
jgi:hypothetical protein